MRFVYNILKSDYGWFWDNIISDEIPYLESLVPYDLTPTNTGQYKNTLFILSVESPKSRQVFNRSYLKLQQAMASLGGLSHALILLVKIVSDPHLKFVMYFFIREAAIISLMKNDLENSISNNIINQHKNKDDQSSIKPKSIYLNNQNKTKFTTVDYKKLEESAVSDMRKEIRNDVNSLNVQQVNEVKTVIRFQNNENNQNNQKKDQKDKNNENEENKVMEKLNLMKTKLSYFSPSVVENIKGGKGGESYTDYILTLVCCKKEKIKYYNKQMKAIRKLISVHTYTNLVIKEAFKEEAEIYDSMRVVK